jgi:hypothetical protein
MYFLTAFGLTETTSGCSIKSQRLMCHAVLLQALPSASFKASTANQPGPSKFRSYRLSAGGEVFGSNKQQCGGLGKFMDRFFLKIAT